jgi:hypothetical protein
MAKACNFCSSRTLHVLTILKRLNKDLDRLIEVLDADESAGEIPIANI